MANTRKIEVVLVGNASQLEAALGKASASVRGFGKIGDAVHAGFSRVASGIKKAAKVGGLGVAAGLGLSIKAAADFQTTLNTLWAVADHGGVKLSDVSKKAIQLGADIKLPSTSAKDAAEAMFELAKGGLDAGQAMAAARGTILLSTAAQIDNATAGKVVVQALKAFRLPASAAQKVVDDFAGAANQSTADMQGVTEAMAQAGSGAKALRVPLGDTATAIAMLANAGIQGGMAGSALNTALSRLASGAKPVRDELKKLNIGAFDAQGNFIGMSKFAGVYTSAMKKLTPQQRLQAATTIFGLRGMKAAINVFGDGSKAFDDLKKKVTKAGQAQKLADAQTAGFKGAMSGLVSTLETLEITVGARLLPYATRFVRWLTDVANEKNTDAAIRKVSDVLDSLVPKLKAAWDFGKKAFQVYKDNADVIQVAAGALAGLVLGIEAVTLALKAWLPIQLAIDAALDGNPIGLVVIAIGALVGALVVLYTKNKAFHDAVVATFGWMRTNIPPIIQQIASILRTVWGAMLPYVTTLWNSLKGQVRAALDLIVGFVNLFGDVIHGRWGKVWGDVKAIVSAAMAYVVAVLKGLPAVALQLLARAGAYALRGIASGLKALPGTLWAIIKGAIVGAVNGVPKMLGVLKGAGQSIADSIVGGIQSLPGALVSVARSGLSALAHLLASFHVSIKTKSILGVPVPTGMSVGFSGGGASGGDTGLKDGGDSGLGDFINKVGAAVKSKVTTIVHNLERLSSSSRGAAAASSTRTSGGGGFTTGAPVVPGGGGGGGGGSDKASAAADKLKQKLQALADKAAAVRDEIVSRLDTAFQKVGDFALKAFDATTAKGLQKLQNNADKAANAIQAKLDQTLSQIQAKQAALTPAEQALQALQAGHDQAERDAALAQGQADLAAAKTPADQAAAQKEIDDAVYNQRVFDLGQQAAAERAIADQQAADATAAAQKQADDEKAANDADLARQQLNYQAQRDLQRGALEDQLAAFKANLDKHPKKWKSVHAKIMAMFKDDFGPDFETAGVNIGNAYIKGLAQAFAAVGNLTGPAATAIGTANKASSKVGKHAQGGIFTRPTFGLFGEDGAEAIVPLTKPARARQIMAAAGLGGGGGTVNNFHIYEAQKLDERKLAAKVAFQFRMATL